MTILARLKEKAAEVGREGVERAKAYRKEQVRYRGEVREVREKVARSEIEIEAAPIAKKYGISLEEAIIWLRSERKKKERAVTVERMGTWGDDLDRGKRPKKRKKETQKQYEQRLEDEYYEYEYGETKKEYERRLRRERNGDIRKYQEFIGGDSRFKPIKTKKKITRRRKEESMVEGIFFQPGGSRRDIESSAFIPGGRPQSSGLASGFIPGGGGNSRELASGFIPQGVAQERGLVNITVLSSQHKPVATFRDAIRYDYEYPYVVYKGQSSMVHKQNGKYYIYPKG